MNAPTNKVEIVRLTYGFFVVTVFDLFGRKVRERQSPQFSTETKRREWAIEQAKQYAETFGVWFDPVIYW